MAVFGAAGGLSLRLGPPKMPCSKREILGSDLAPACPPGCGNSDAWVRVTLFVTTSGPFLRGLILRGVSFGMSSRRGGKEVAK
jgi:hypothetical protein